MIMQLVKQVRLKPSRLLDELSIVSKNLFNVANYEVRQYFFKSGKWLRYNTLYNLSMQIF